MLPNYMPSQKTLDERRKPKYIIDPKDVSLKDNLRIRQWGLDVMKKHVSRLTDDVPDRNIVFEKELEPEEIDIKNIYPFQDLYYSIFRLKPYWKLRLLYKRPSKTYGILAELTYANIENI